MKNPKFITFIAIIFLATFVTKARAAIFQYDAAFDDDGFTLLTSTGSDYEAPGDLVILDNGKYLNTGYHQIGGTSGVILWKTNNDGTPDTSFNSTGVRVYDLSIGQSDGLNKIIVDNNGKYVGTGNITISEQNMLLMRVNSDSTLDTTFGGSGYVYISGTAGGDNDYGYDLIQDSENKYVVTGHTQDGLGEYNLGIWKYNQDGTLDDSFGVAGYAVFSWNEGSNIVVGASIAQGVDNKYYVAGHADRTSGNYDLIVVSYNQDGSLNTDFNSTGYVTYNSDLVDDYFDQVFDMFIHDNKIICIGRRGEIDGGQDLVIWRLNMDGTLDNTFNDTGILAFDVDFGDGDESEENATNIVADSNGNYIVGGVTNDGLTGTSYLMLLRIKPDGSFDQGFGDEGVYLEEDTDRLAGTPFVAIDEQNRYIVSTMYYDTVTLQGALRRYENLYNVTNLPEGLNVTFEDLDIEEGSGNGAYGNVLLRLSNSSGIIAEIITTMDEDRDWSSVSGDLSLADYKSFVHNLISAEGTAASYTLFVPFREGDDAVGICPGATSLAAVNAECENLITYTETDSNVTLVTIDSVQYWKVDGMTSTGGFSFSASASPEELAPTGDNTYIVLVAIITLFTTTGLAVSLLTKKP